MMATNNAFHRVPKPQTWDELVSLVAREEVEVLLFEDLADGTSHVLICDHRRTFEEGEIYELIL